MNEIFSKFKNIHNGYDIALIATGPSLDDFIPLENVIYIGVNGAVNYDKVAFDYLFIQDAFNQANNIDKFIKYNNIKCIKFMGDISHIYPNSAIPGNIRESANAYNYTVNSIDERFPLDLNISPMPRHHSIVFPALAFALWTNPKRIYLVGCDCAEIGYSKIEKKSSETLNKSIYKIKIGWDEFKKFATEYYPDTKIISINPVGLKGMFLDKYTKK